ncbi:MAG: pyridoxal phosphate-dependent aminotransferase [Bacteroidota bacterium]
MPALSTRATVIPASPIRKLVPYAEAAKAKGTHVYHLNIGQPDLETPPGFLAAIQQADLRVVAYSHSAGMAPLRAGIRSYYASLGHPLKEEEALVTTGASEALNFVFAACLNPGDEIIVPEPFYANYHSFGVFSNVKVVPLRTELQEDFALPPTEAFEALITPRTKAILICNPGNPTGILYPKATLEKLQQIVLKHNLFLIADEVYREFAYDGLQHHSILGFPELEQHAVVVDSISKRFSACGARIGCVISRNHEVMAAVLKFAQARLSPPSLAQIGATALYQLDQSYYQEVNAEYAQRRDVLLEGLRAIPGVRVPQVNGAFYAMVELPIEDSSHFCQWMLESFSHEGATVMMAPGDGFYATEGRGKQEVRIAYVLKEADLKQAIATLAAGLAAYPGK